MDKAPDFIVELSVNGKDVVMNEFVHRIVDNLILAILNSIRLAEEPRTAALKLKIR
jgi:hypothetical protein